MERRVQASQNELIMMILTSGTATVLLLYSIETIATLLLLQYAPIVKTVYSGLSGGIGGSRLLAQNKSL